MRADRSDDLQYLEDMLEAAEKIERFTAGMNRAAFKQDEKTVDAVLRNLEIIGEASKLLSEEVRSAYPAVQWSAMAGMRDKLIHGYATVDLDIVWETVQREVPLLIEQLDTLIEEIEHRGAR
jgi:uncharacterized protein with HEPN domain